jgi:probable HAF family extracellular repeat protein
VDSGGTFTTFAAPGAVQTTALGINNTGQIVGSAFDGMNPTQGFLYSGGAFTTINNPTGTGEYLQASGINDGGQIVGTSETTSGNFTGSQGYLLLPDGTFSFLNVPGSTSTFANGINNAGQIAGRFYDSSSQHGFLYSGGVYSPFNVPGSMNSVTEITGINNAGQIVGTFNDGSTTRSFLYSNNTFSMINVPGSQLTLVSGINDAGQLVGTFSLNAGGHEGFIASPVPLPTSLLLFASGLLGLSRLLSRRREDREQIRHMSKTDL